MRIWVIENGLLDHTGHHFNNSVGLRDECARRGIQTHFLVHRSADPRVIRMFDARPLFDFGPYDLASNDPLAGPLENLILQGRAFGQSLASIGDELRADDLVLAPSTLQNELYGFALALARMTPEQRPRLALTLIVENFFAPGTRGLGLGAALYRFAARQLTQVTPVERLLLGANGPAMASAYAQVLGLPVSEFPIPKLYPVQTARTPSDGSPPVVAILGHSRAEKGFLLVPELVERNRALRFLIQVSPKDADLMWKEARPSMHSAPNVELVQGALDPDAYHALMARADIVLLPYDPALMPMRSSGVFAEAVGAGRVTVVPAGTWMSSHLDAGRGAGIAFSECNANAISVALREAAARLPELSPRAAESAMAWRAQQSTGAYLTRVLEKFGLGPGPA